MHFVSQHVHAYSWCTERIKDFFFFFAFEYKQHEGYFLDIKENEVKMTTSNTEN